MDTITMNIAGMSCGHCVGAVTRALNAIDGVAVEQVALGMARVSYNPDETSPERIAAALAVEGYPVLAAAK